MPHTTTTVDFEKRNVSDDLLFGLQRFAKCSNVFLAKGERILDHPFPGAKFNVKSQVTVKDRQSAQTREGS